MKGPCPQCSRTVDADFIERGNEYWILKKCPKHGSFEDRFISKGLFKRLTHFGEQNAPKKFNCGNCKGICRAHQSKTLLGIVDVTMRCNLKCPDCFANAGKGKDLSMSQIENAMKAIKKVSPQCYSIQFSGGEPLMHPKIVEIIKLAKKNNFNQVQIATNGLLLTEELAKELRAAGLNIIYLQFDGMEGETYKKLRGANLLPKKMRAISNWAKTSGHVVLVPTVTKSTLHEVPKIIEFALNNNDVAGVNFQPISFVGRSHYAHDERVTMSDILDLINAKLGRDYSCWFPVNAGNLFLEMMGYDYPFFTTNCLCGASTFILRGNEKKLSDVFSKLNQLLEKQMSGKKVSKIEVMMNFMKIIQTKDIFEFMKNPNFYTLGNIFYYNLLLLSCMWFQDPWNMLYERTNRCSVHFGLPNGRVVPFCIMNSFGR